MSAASPSALLRLGLEVGAAGIASDVKLEVQLARVDRLNDRVDNNRRIGKVLDLHGIHALSQLQRLAAVTDLEEHLTAEIGEPAFANLAGRFGVAKQITTSPHPGSRDPFGGRRRYSCLNDGGLHLSGAFAYGGF